MNSCRRICSTYNKQTYDRRDWNTTECICSLRFFFRSFVLINVRPRFWTIRCIWKMLTFQFDAFRNYSKSIFVINSINRWFPSARKGAFQPKKNRVKMYSIVNRIVNVYSLSHRSHSSRLPYVAIFRSGFAASRDDGLRATIKITFRLKWFRRKSYGGLNA